MWLLPLLLLADPNSAESPHFDRNPVYRELRKNGVSVTATDSFKLQPPYMADGLDAAAQRKLIEQLGGRRYRWEELTRDSTVAPQIIQLDQEKPRNTDTKARVAHVYFIVHGELETLTEGDDPAQPDTSETQQWKPLSAEDLAAKNIKVEEPDHESYGYITHDLIDRVRLTGVLRTYWSETEESVVAAAMLDPRFNEDADYPNRWQPLTRGREGFEAGKSAPYHGAGGYSKITKLKSPQGALFVEFHVIFSEPHGWFNGANLLASKLPVVFQHEVRSSRREFKEAGDKKK